MVGSTGLTTSDVRTWLQAHPALYELMGEALAVPVRPVLVSQHDLIDVAEGEFERDRPNPERSMGLPPPADAGAQVAEINLRAANQRRPPERAPASPAPGVDASG